MTGVQTCALPIFSGTDHAGNALVLAEGVNADQNAVTEESDVFTTRAKVLDTVSPMFKPVSYTHLYLMARIYRDIGKFNRDITLNMEEASDQGLYQRCV